MALVTVFCGGAFAADTARPNILFAIADDWGLHAGAYGTRWVKTPAFDRIAREGLLFQNAYAPMAKCAPSRASVLTGRHLWQNEEAGNHLAVFPLTLKSWSEALMEKGWHIGITGKGWGPGIANDPEHSEHMTALRQRMELMLKAQGDPRMRGRGQVFDSYKPTSGDGLSEKFMRGEKVSTGWVNPTDFEKQPIP